MQDTNSLGMEACARVHLVNSVLADCLRQFAALFQYAGIEPDFSAQDCYFELKNDLIAVPHQLSEVVPHLIHFLSEYNDCMEMERLRTILRQQDTAIHQAYHAVEIEQQAIFWGARAAKWNVRQTNYNPVYLTALKRYLAGEMQQLSKEQFEQAVSQMPTQIKACFSFEHRQSDYVRFYRLHNIPISEETLVQRIHIVYDEENQPRQAATYDAREHRPAQVSGHPDFARQISEAPKNLLFEHKNFVLTGGNKEKLSAYILAHGGQIRKSTVRQTDYLIIGDDIWRETNKITRAKQLNTQQHKTIQALWEHEFWRLVESH